MKNTLILIFTLTFSITTLSQSSKDIKDFYKAFDKYKSNDLSDALFNINWIIDKNPNVTEFRRLRTQIYSAMHDSCNLCDDLYILSKVFMDSIAEIGYNQSCFTQDTLLEIPDSMSEEYPGAVYCIRYNKICSSAEYVIYYNELDSVIPSLYLKIAEFPGGDVERNNFLAKECTYPEAARLRGISGTVLLSFVIDQSGKIQEIKVLFSPHASLSKESIRVVKLMPKWKPGSLKGEPIRSEFNMPIKFAFSD